MTCLDGLDGLAASRPAQPYGLLPAVILNRQSVDSRCSCDAVTQSSFFSPWLLLFRFFPSKHRPGVFSGRFAGLRSGVVVFIRSARHRRQTAVWASVSSCSAALIRF